MNCSRCRSHRGLSAKSTSARFSSAPRSMREASDGSRSSWLTARSATSLLRLTECGQFAIDLGHVERLGLAGVVLGPVLHRRVALVCHADRVVLARVARNSLLQEHLMLPAGPKVVRVADLPAGHQRIPHLDRAFVRSPFQVHERVAVLLLPRLEDRKSTRLNSSHPSISY